ncbi:hypothetical protein GF371_04660 [Candidatus Woesearchaeota archaeon]|nr:hypothetical protein [Candidatus Woesearchaeota archaeon]
MRNIRKANYLLISVLFIFLFSIIAVAQDLPPPPPTPGLGAPAAAPAENDTAETDDEVPPPAVPGEPAAPTALTSAEREQYETQISRLQQEKINLQKTIEQMQKQKIQTDKAMQELVARVQEAEKTRPNYPFYITLTLAIVLVFFILYKFLLSRKGKPSMPKAKPFDPNMRKLTSFIRNARRQGYNYESVSQHLRDCGWSQQQIDKAYTYLK